MTLAISAVWFVLLTTRVVSCGLVQPCFRAKKAIDEDLKFRGEFGVFPVSVEGKSPLVLTNE